MWNCSKAAQCYLAAAWAWWPFCVWPQLRLLNRAANGQLAADNCHVRHYQHSLGDRANADNVGHDSCQRPVVRWRRDSRALTAAKHKKATRPTPPPNSIVRPLSSSTLALPIIATRPAVKASVGIATAPR